MVGYKIQNLDTIDSIYCCPHCLLLLRDPVQFINCAHRHCQSCVNDQQEGMIICSACHERTSRDNLKLDRGFKNDMQSLSVNCAFCSWIGVLKNYQNHLDQDHSNPTCTYCDDQFTSVNDLNTHQLFACDKITVDCPLKHMGCDGEILRIDLLKHYSSERHQRTIINFILQIPTKHLLQTASITARQLQEVDETVNILSAATETLSDDLRRLANELSQRQNTLQSVEQRVPALKKSIDDQNTFLDNMKSNQPIFEEDLSSATRKLEEMKLVSNDGIYIWKINNVKEKIGGLFAYLIGPDESIAAQSGTQISIDSPPFCSSPTGYKMCLRLYLYGDDDSRNTHLSLHFVLMRGEFDAILKYPFCFKLIFCLYDQTDQHNHIVHALRPNVTSKNYQRPQSEMTVASEISQFASVEILQQENSPYIRDDAMFIKTMIDFENVAKDVLPYAMNLNPALTTQMQQSMIRQETEKQR